MPTSRDTAGVRCVLFDLDGTLVDSRQDIATSLDAALATHGLGPLGIEKARSFVGDGVRKLIERAIEATGGDPADTDRLIETYLDAYRVRHLDTTSLYGGVAETLQLLAARGVACGVVTNKPWEFSVSLLEHLGVRRYFASVIGGDSLASRKPDPEPLYVAIDECGAQRSLSVMVGDGETDIRAGKAAGIRTVAVTYGFRDAAALAPLAPDAVIDSMTELVPALWPSTN